MLLVLASLTASCEWLTRAAAHNDLGVTYGRTGDYDRAITEFDKAIQLKPDYAEAYDQRGLAYGRKGESDRAIADHDKAIQLKPDYAVAYYNRGYSYGMKGDSARAIADLKKCLELTSNTDLREAARHVLSMLGAE